MAGCNFHIRDHPTFAKKTERLPLALIGFRPPFVLRALPLLVIETTRRHLSRPHLPPNKSHLSPFDSTQPLHLLLPLAFPLLHPLLSHPLHPHCFVLLITLRSLFPLGFHTRRCLGRPLSRSARSLASCCPLPLLSTGSLTRLAMIMRSISVKSCRGVFYWWCCCVGKIISLDR